METHLIPLAEIPAVERSYTYDPVINTNNNQYRLKVTFADGHHYYSNIVSTR